MNEILQKLRPGSLVLDLGCAKGSFRSSATRATVIRVDREAPRDRADQALFVQADASALPFSDRTFAAVVSNHSLEHFDDPERALREISRVVHPEGALFVAVPDSSTLTDRLYRWLARGGGHVNAFTSPTETAAMIELVTGFRHVATRLLYSSLSFLNRCNAPRPLPRRLWLLGAGCEWPLFAYALLSRRFDRWFGSRSSIYGWAFYFGNIGVTIDTGAWTNVCIRCGSGYSACFLHKCSLIHSNFMKVRTFQCPECGAVNPFSEC